MRKIIGIIIHEMALNFIKEQEGLTSLYKTKEIDSMSEKLIPHYIMRKPNFSRLIEL